MLVNNQQVTVLLTSLAKLPWTRKLREEAVFLANSELLSYLNFRYIKHPYISFVQQLRKLNACMMLGRGHIFDLYIKFSTLSTAEYMRSSL